MKYKPNAAVMTSATRLFTMTEHERNRDIFWRMKEYKNTKWWEWIKRRDLIRQVFYIVSILDD